VNQIKSKNTLINWELVAVNPNDKNWNWKDLFYFWANNIQSLIAFSLIASLYLVYELNVFVVLAGSLIASIFVYFFANLIGKPSQKYGLPFPVILRTSIGIKGAKYFALLRGLVGIFMFGIQTYFLSKLFSYLIRITLYSIENSLLDQDLFLQFYCKLFYLVKAISLIDF
jgi:NCS1 family nucleobase:cation symporter-1